MRPTYKIHPGIGIARLGNSPDEFCISPEKPAALPIACDRRGNPLLTPDGASERSIEKFKDREGRIKRQAARFQVYVYDDQSPDGRPLKIGDPIRGGGNDGYLVDIQWRVYLANKKAVWYEFEQLEGEHGYAPGHSRRNAGITDPEARQKLIIDPGPRVVNCTDRRRARFDRDGRDLYAPTFPPPLQPHSIDTLGEIMTDDSARLLVLGGHGHSGSYEFGQFGQPRISSYANNDGWFDDTSDGPVMARLVMFSPEVQQVRFIDVEYPAWVIAGYPAYAPEILDIVTLEDVLTDLAIREFAARPDLYGQSGTFDDPPHIPPTDTAALIHWKAGNLQWNFAYKPWFYRDIWPILFRPDEYTYLCNILQQSNAPHNQTGRGTFDPYRLSVPPVVNRRAVEACRRSCVERNDSGHLFLDAVDPVLATIDSEANSTLGRNLERFDQAVQRLISGYESQGRQFPEPQREQYRSWLARLQGEYPEYLGELLFVRFRDELPLLLRGFAERVSGEKMDEARNEIRSAEAQQVEALFSGYLEAWKSTYAGDTADYQREKKSLEESIRELIERLKKQALERWAEDVGRPNPLDEWGPPFSRQRQSLDTGIAEFVEQFVFDKLGNATQAQLKLYRSGQLLEECERRCIRAATYDPFRDDRQFLYRLLRRPGEENHFRQGGKPNQRTHNLPLMPLLCGDNPITNTLPSKFFRLTDYQLFLLRQWADGLFVNEKMGGATPKDIYQPYSNWVNRTGDELDRGVLFNLLGGSFCPGAEVTWIIRNPAIYREPFRLKADADFYTFRQTAAQANQQRGQVPDVDYVSYQSTALSQDSDFETGLQPGDLTKYMAVPWQSDFNECSTQPINVTYEEWNRLYPESEQDSLLKAEEQAWETMWWPAHRPLQTYEVIGSSDGSPAFRMLNWTRGIPGSYAGDLKMATAWSELGFVVRNPFLSESALDQPSPDFKYISVERNQEGDDE